jgi:hypothetical protein
MIHSDGENMESPILQKSIDRILEKNPQIKEALKLFRISEEQYSRAMQSLKPEPTTSNKATIIIDCDAV